MANANYDSMFSQKTCMHMFIVALFIIVKNYKHKCPSVGKWINTLWCNHKKEFYSAIIRKSTIVKCNNVAESQMHNAKHKNLDSKGFTVNPFTGHSHEGKIIGTEKKRPVVVSI